ncbi:hypothetical protein [Flammeovirga aprica]|uniref:PsbP C-terminal domain-containing protein n=1 Tax=Flammeovirga aprica JL-4 TaxID=694437 RepID=A0A7X9RZP7_9BACT|nr:hypothetical protein [Flammeovirga aprica]NME71589.1 hypothetical protein [Flammeovirga aprica JL-4]
MKYLIVLIAFLFMASCGNQEITIKKFENFGVSLNYPSNWSRIENEAVLFGITDYDLLEGSGSNILLLSTDTLESRYYGIKSFEQFANNLFQEQKKTDKKLLTKNLEEVYLNKTLCKKFSIQVEGNFSTLIQSTYLFDYNGSYYSLIITEPIEIESGKAEENQKILSSLALKNLEIKNLI